MGLAIDSANPWRSAAFSSIPVKRLAVPAPTRGVVNDAHDVETGLTDHTCKAWLEDVNLNRLSDVDVINATITQQLQVDMEVGSKLNRSVDDARGIHRVVPYLYTGEKRTQVHLTHAGRHIVVRPRVDGTVVTAMEQAPSVDKWVQAAGIKLPRVIASKSTGTAVTGMPRVDGAKDDTVDRTSSEFEALRKLAASHANSDDYGDRLFNLARVVCHARAAKMMRREQPENPAMRNASDIHSILTADTPSIRVGELRDYVYLYTHTDDTEEYKAFLIMGVRGVHNYADDIGSVYSECRVEAEAKPGDKIVFIRVGGEQPMRVAPRATAYTRVLNNPEMCLAFYYAYARSMGLGESATSVLVQTAVAPHMWLNDAISPYKNCRPKLDACRYAVLPDEDTAYTTLTSTRGLVHNAAVLAAAYKAGLGCLVMGFKSGRDVDDRGVVNQWMERLADPELRRTIARAVCGRFARGNVGLEWFTPFSYDVKRGYHACVEAWREMGYLLALYRTCPVSSVAPCFTTGVDMANAMIGKRMVDRPQAYAQTVVCALMAGAQLPGMCEPVTAGLATKLNVVAPMLRSWSPVITIVRLTGMKTHNSKLEDSPHRHPPSELIEPSSVGADNSHSMSHSRSDSYEEEQSDQDEAVMVVPEVRTRSQSEYMTAQANSRHSSSPRVSISLASRPRTHSRGASLSTRSKSSTVKPSGEQRQPAEVVSTSKPPVSTTDDEEEEEEEVAPPMPLKIGREVRKLEPPRASTASDSAVTRLSDATAAGLRQSETTGRLADSLTRRKSAGSDNGAGKSQGTVATARTKSVNLSGTNI